jgi:hypothetical protein
MRQRDEGHQPSAISAQSLQQSCTEWDGLNARQKKKYRNLAKWWFAPAYFIASYFLKRGFVDGSVGLYFSVLKAIYLFSDPLEDLGGAQVYGKLTAIFVVDEVLLCAETSGFLHQIMAQLH